MKRVLSVLLTLCLLLGIFAIPALAAMEAEENDSFATAQRIAVNEPVTGNLKSSSDEDYYLFSLESPGRVSLSFSHAYLENNYTYWRVGLYTDDYNELTTFPIYGHDINNDLTSIGLPSGDYYIRIRDSSFSNIAYTLTVDYLMSDEWESEFNDTFYTSDPINLNSSIKGSLMHSSDKDYYTFTLETAGYINLNFNHDYLEQNYTYWKAAFYTEDFKQLADFSVSGHDVKTNSCPIGLPAGTYYVEVKDSSYSATTYELTVSFTASDAWETEFNDSFDSADTIFLNSFVTGSFMNSSDIDNYHFSLSTSQAYTLIFKHDYLEHNYTYWRIGIYDDEFNSIMTFSETGNNVESKFELFGLTPGDYYIRITDSSHSSIPYTFAVANDSFFGTPEVPVTVSGRIVYHDMSSTAKVTLIDTETGEEFGPVETGKDGTYTIEGVVPGTYNIQVVKPGYAMLTKQNFQVTDSGEIPDISISSLAGDINGDNVISLEDLTILLRNFGNGASGGVFID